jgi:thiol-disulfide isomerase/thioredoxin
MQRFLVICFLLVAVSTSRGQVPVRIIHLPELEQLLQPASDSVTVLNFWATWCKPCVEELPVFFKLEQEFKNQKVRFIYLNLDFKREANTKLADFLLRKQINSTVYLLDEPDYNAWIDKVSPNWQGSIPATIIIGPHTKSFHEGTLEEPSLRQLIQQSASKN